MIHTIQGWVDHPDGLVAVAVTFGGLVMIVILKALEGPKKP
ncbi:MAG: hypothetical protein ACREQ5_00145 [Candidatus Dormibacteria bacterium]